MTSQEREELKEAALRGDVKFLRKCVANNKPIEYYTNLPTKHRFTNIFHLAATKNRKDFIREAIERLPLEAIHQLLLQPRGDNEVNPLHIAASYGNLEIVKLFLHNVFKSLPSSLSCSRKPWLERTRDEGYTPCHTALIFGHEDCGLEILKMDVQLLGNITDNCNTSLLYLAVNKGFNGFALEILRSAPSFSCNGPDGFTPLHRVTNCSEGEDICRQLLVREPKLIVQRSTRGHSILHTWAHVGRLWPFECLLRSNDIILDVRRVLVELISATDENGFNPLHVLALITPTEKDVVEIAKLLIDTYKQEISTLATSSKDQQFPWLVRDNKGGTPLALAIHRRYERFAVYILSVDNNALIKCQENALFFAIEKGCNEVLRKIMEIIDKLNWTQLLTNDLHQNVLHLAPKCTIDICEQLLKQHPELLEGVDKEGTTVLHSWVKIGEIWPFEYLLQSGEIDPKWRSYFIKLISTLDYKDRNNPLHVAAATTTSSHEETYQVVKLLIEAYKEEIPNWRSLPEPALPWFDMNKAKNGVLNLAIQNGHEKLALYILSLLNAHINSLLNFYEPEHKILFLAIEKKCYQVAKVIMSKLDKERRTKYLTDSSEGRSVLHLAPTCTDKEFGTWLVNEASEFITKADKSGNTPLDEASDVGAAWIIQVMLEKDQSAFNKAPLARVKACKKGHVSALCAFINNCPGKFKDHCIKHKDSPLHHIQKLSNLTEYEEFLKIPHMKDLINVQDSRGATPLHQAIRNQNIFLTETLLNVDKIMYNIKDHENETARGLLEQMCNQKYEWDQMCKNIGFDPRIKTTYFQRKTNLLDVRNTLSVVAALLATITFTAGFTLPGGFNQDTGEAILAKKVAFIVFLLSDTLAMCCSMLVLSCLIWSMVYDSNKSLFLIDRSMVLLMIALHSTLLAFVTGVYIVIAPKSLWVAIVIIVMCSLIGMLSANRILLYKVLDSFIPSANKEYGDQIRLVELGKICVCRRGSSCLKCN